MTTYHPCLRCPLGRREPCPVKDAMRKHVGRSDITIVRFKCPVFESLFRVGQRVEVSLGYFEPAHHYYDGYAYSAGKWTGVIVGRSLKKDKWTVFLDDGWKEQDCFVKNERGVVALYPKYIKALDEADAPERLRELLRRDAEKGAEVFA